MRLNNMEHIACDIVRRHMRKYSSGIAILRQMAERLELCPLGREHIREGRSVVGVGAKVERRPLGIRQEERDNWGAVLDAYE
jgi:hypothetical protein